MAFPTINRISVGGKTPTSFHSKRYEKLFAIMMEWLGQEGCKIFKGDHPRAGVGQKGDLLILAHQFDTLDKY
jgi:hypothetical protein